jgi:hypothetical protein
VEYSINYDVDSAPYYEMLPHKFPSEEQMTEFMFNYQKELQPNADDKSLYVMAAEMVKETIPFVPVSHLFWGVWGLL